MPTALEERARQLETLSPHFRAMARALVAGATPSQLSDRFGLLPPRISDIIHSPLFKAEVRRLESRAEDVTIEAIKADLESLRPVAVEVIAEDLHMQKASRRRTKSAFDLLDRTDFFPRKPKDEGAPAGINVLILSPFPGEDPQVAKERIAQVRLKVQEKAEEEAIDAEFEEELEQVQGEHGAHTEEDE